MSLPRSPDDGLFQRHDHRRADFPLKLAQLFDRDPHAIGDQLVVGHMAYLRFEFVDDPLENARLLANRSRYPIQRPQRIDNRAVDAGDRVGFELDARDRRRIFRRRRSAR